ncbi:MAG TPA: TolC family protein [Candidatus Udaeobacter sp.]|nr:TolC family protein [Candidatus Udaeobacter sp.]
MKLQRIIAWPCVLIAAGALFCSGGARPQGTEVPGGNGSSQAASQGTANAAQPRRLTLQDALALARKNSTPFQAAQTEAAISRQDRYQAATALLPSVNYNNQALYTQGNGPGNAVRFIANNAVHEYLSQADIHEAIDLVSISNFRRTSAAAAAARARAEIASRGLVVTVVQSYYAVAAAQLKLQSAQKAADEGDRFFKLTQDLEHGGEVAHSDVIKAELQMQERRRQLQEAQLALLNARLDLAVLIFPDFNDNYEIAEDLHSLVPLPTLGEFQQQAAHDNPDVRAALEAARAAGSDVTSARAGYLPSLSLDYWYGIDAARFAVNGPNGASNLGSSASATLNIPIWNWGATQSRIKQAELRHSQAQRELSLAQRKLLAEIKSLYAEAETALNELGGLNRSTELASDSLRLITLRYTNGESTVLEVVDAQSTAAQASSAYQDGAVRYRVALANLQTLTGVLTTP